MFKKTTPFAAANAADDIAGYCGLTITEASPHRGVAVSLNINAVVASYIEAMLWSSRGDDEEFLDATFSASDIAPEAMTMIEKDCQSFVDRALPLIEATGLIEGQVGHDLWLTRAGHGAGFWDRGLGEAGSQLSAICDDMGQVDVYIGDDGRLYIQ